MARNSMRLFRNVSTNRLRPEKSSRQKGFTLLEILIAVTILGLAYVAILQNFSESMSNIVRLDDRRTEVLEDSITFAQKTQPYLFGNDEEGDGETDAPVFLEGHKYQLIIVTDDKDNFMSLKLKTL